MGLSKQLQGALKSVSQPIERLGGSRIQDNFALLEGFVQAFNEDDSSCFHSRGSKLFIVRKPGHAYFRFKTQLRFWQDRRFSSDVSVYVEDIKTKLMAPVVKVRTVQDLTGKLLVWLGKTTCEPVVMSYWDQLYVSDEPYVAGMTLKELEESYA